MTVKLDQVSKLKKYFDKYDTDGSGTITMDELEALLRFGRTQSTCVCQFF